MKQHIAIWGSSADHNGVLVFLFAGVVFFVKNAT